MGKDNPHLLDKIKHMLLNRPVVAVAVLAFILVSGLYKFLDSVSGIQGMLSNPKAEITVERFFLADPGTASEFGQWELRQVPANEHFVPRYDFPDTGFLNKYGREKEIRALFSSNRPIHQFDWYLSSRVSRDDEPEESYIGPNLRPEYLQQIEEDVRQNKLYTDKEFWGPDYQQMADLFDDNQDPQVTEELLERVMEWAVYRYIARTVPPLPAINIVLRNTGTADATMYGFSFENYAWTGGDAGSGGSPLQTVNQDQLVELSHEDNATLTFQNPIVLAPKDVTMLTVRPIVKDASPGDGPGSLVYRLVLSLYNGEKDALLEIGYFEQKDDVY